MTMIPKRTNTLSVINTLSPLLVISSNWPNVDVTGDRGTVRPKGADARGRPC